MTLLRLRDVRLIVGAVGLSAFGDFLALFGPVVACGGLAGRLTDRFENARLLWSVSLAQALVVGAMAFATGSLAAILVLTVLLGVGVALSQPAEFALVPAAAGEERLTEANGLVETSRYVGMTAGPLLGGALAAAGALEVALLLDAASFLAVAVAARAMHARRRGTA